MSRPVRMLYAWRYFSLVFAGDLVRQRRRRRLLVPVDRFQVIAHELLIERKLRPARLVRIRRPEARRIRREHFVAQHQFLAHESELELRVRDDDALRLRVLRRARINRQRQIAQPLRKILADQRHHVLERDILVMPGLRLRRRREDRLRQLVALAQARRQPDAAHRSALLILLPARSGDVAARHAFDLDHVGALHEHRAAFQLIGKCRQRLRVFLDIGRQKMRGREVAQKIEPEDRKLREHPALVRECRSAEYNRTPRSGRWRRSGACRQRDKHRGLCRCRGARCRPDPFQNDSIAGGFHSSLRNAFGGVT